MEIITFAFNQHTFGQSVSVPQDYVITLSAVIKIIYASSILIIAQIAPSSAKTKVMLYLFDVKFN